MSPHFALNHMTVARLDFAATLDLASRLGCVGVELRNDLPGPLFDGLPPEEAGRHIKGQGLRLLALAEVKMFNDWSPAKEAEAVALMRIARAAGAEAVSLIPRNDNREMGLTERRDALVRSLAALRPMLEDHGLTGMVEPLGFASCPLRFKSEAVAAIEEVDGANHFKLVHDTFHHTIAGAPDLFPAHTGIVHVSGVTAPGLAPSVMQDRHRHLVDADDRLENISQIEALRDAGWSGAISFEAFSPEVHGLEDPGAALAASMQFIRRALVAPVT